MSDVDAVDIFLETSDKKTKFQFPVLPEKLTISGSSGNQSIETIKLGEVTVLGDRNLRTFEIESFFTANPEAPFCRTKGSAYKSPKDCVALITAMQEAQEPVRFIATGLELNSFWTTIEAFSWEYGAGTGDIGFTASFKEYRPFGQRAKTLDKAPDLFNTGAEQRVFEAAGGIREPTALAIGDRVLVSGIYFSSPNGARAFFDVPNDFLTKPWSSTIETAYSAVSNRVVALNARRAIIIDFVQTQFISSGLEDITKQQITSPAPYCIADLATRKRIGWVNKDQMTRI